MVTITCKEMEGEILLTSYIERPKREMIMLDDICDVSVSCPSSHNIILLISCCFRSFN